MQQHINGLSGQEVSKRMQEGLTNAYDTNISKSTKGIVKDNIFTLFNFLNFFIAIILVLVGAFSNLFFIAIIIMNITIGIIVEIRARNMVQSLSILNKAKTSVIRDGKETEIFADDIVMDDILLVKMGEQIPADSIVVDGTVEMNESLLTGESNLIAKNKEDELLSGSYVASGQCYAKVHHVGAENYSTKLAIEAKKHKPVTSELLNALRKIAKFTSIIIIPFGLILFLEGFIIRNDGIKNSVVSSAAAMLGMLPKGLALLIIIALATAVIKLGKKKILVQEMYAVETLAHVDVLCLDKTGTITEGKMKVKKMNAVSENYSQEHLEKILSNYLYHTVDNNLTMNALNQHIEKQNLFSATDTIAFSSEKKWGAMYMEEVGTVLIGATEKIINGTLHTKLQEDVENLQKDGFRVIAVGVSKERTIDTIPNEIEPIALISIEDPIRSNVKETLDYLSSEGVELKIISGDNPITVSKIAQNAGFKEYDKFLDASVLTDEELKEKVRTTSIFGRVSPQQKKLIVNTLQSDKKTVAMTGDGVNDILALKEADCGIAMAQGDPATRQIANIVLLESDFTALPDVLFEGRRVVNNVTRVASIFFIKTIYSFILSILCAITTIGFPFIPIQITLIDLAIEGYPSFFLSFESNKKKITGTFLKTALLSALPNALLVVGNVVAASLLGAKLGWSGLETQTLMYYLLIGISLFAVIKTCIPFNPLRVFLSLTTTVGVYVAAILFQSMLKIGTLTSNTFLPFIILIGASLVVRIIIDLIQKVKRDSIKTSSKVAV